MRTEEEIKAMIEDFEKRLDDGKRDFGIDILLWVLGGELTVVAP